MSVNVSELIDAPRERVWDIITDVDNWSDLISGIIDVEVLDRPAEGVIGLKWREKRVLFGKEATETMWISDAVPGQWYETMAHNHGAIYTTRVSVDDEGGKSRLSMTFTAAGTTVFSKMMSSMGFLFNGTIRKALQQDLREIRAFAER